MVYSSLPSSRQVRSVDAGARASSESGPQFTRGGEGHGRAARGPGGADHRRGLDRPGLGQWQGHGGAVRARRRQGVRGRPQPGGGRRDPGDHRAGGRRLPRPTRPTSPRPRASRTWWPLACARSVGSTSWSTTSASRRTGGIVTTAEADWDQVCDVNLKSVFLTCKHVVPVMERQGKGAIVNIASIAAHRWTGISLRELLRDQGRRRGALARDRARARGQGHPLQLGLARADEHAHGPPRPDRAPMAKTATSRT